MPPEAPVHAICAMGVEAWGVRRRAPHLRVVRVGIGGRPPAGLPGIMISAGLCGGLLPEQTSGMVVIASQVVDEQGVTHACDPGVVGALEKAARYLRLPFTGGSLISTSGMVTGPDRGTWAGRGHVAVDMESAAAARIGRSVSAFSGSFSIPLRASWSGAWAKPGVPFAGRPTGARQSGSGSTPRATRSGSGRC